ncbi:MAG: TraR/DksA C4-type zinc finger protein [Acidimicrobiales bacterium]
MDEDLNAVAELEEELHDVERALSRLDEGTYGTCEACGERLPEDVLVQRPAARFCAAHLPLHIA